MKYSIAFVLGLAAPPVVAQSPPVPPAFSTAGAFVAFSVPDIEGGARWYVEKLGLRVVFEPPAANGVRAVILEGGGLIVELIHNPSAVPLATAVPSIQHQHPTMVHGIFKAGIVVENYDRVLATIRERGVPIALGPFPERDGQRANFLIRDSAGNLLQFFAR